MNTNGLLYPRVFQPAHNAEMPQGSVVNGQARQDSCVSSVECISDEWFDPLRPLCRDGNGHLLCIGTAQLLVYSRLRCVLCIRVGLWLSSRRVAIRFGGGGMVGHRSSAVVDYTA